MNSGIPTSLNANFASAVVGAMDVSATPTVASSTDGAAGLLPSPQRVDVGVAVAQMMIESAFAQRHQAREDRKVATNQMVQAQRNQIAKLHEEADKRFDAATVEAWGKIVEGAHGIAGGVLNATSGLHQANAGIGEAVTSTGKIDGAFSGLMSAGDRRDADLAGAAAKQSEMEATQEKRLVDNADSDEKEARDLTKRALDFLREFQSTESHAMSSALKG